MEELVNICFVTNRPTWPLYPGFKRRAGMVLLALEAIGDVDLVMALPDEYSSVPSPPTLDAQRVTLTQVMRPRKAKAVGQWLRGPLPMSMNSVTWSSGSSVVQQRLSAKPYDIVWVLAGTAWPLVRGIIDQFPSTNFVIDLDDLEDEKIRHRQATTSINFRSPSSVAHRLVDTVDVRRWERLHQEIAARSSAITVCSATDVAKLQSRFPSANVQAVPNGYNDPGRVQTDDDVDRAAPTILFVGDLKYRPNEEAARFLCCDVLPIIRRTCPEVLVRLVGGAGDAHDLAGAPGVQVAGVVESIEHELLRSTISAAPLLSGGGTRIKIIEAFAHGVPVVSTTIGAEGLDVQQGNHLLMGDSPEDFARSCCSIIESESLRSRLRSGGRERFVESFTSSTVDEAVRSVVAGVVATRRYPTTDTIVRLRRSPIKTRS